MKLRPTMGTLALALLLTVSACGGADESEEPDSASGETATVVAADLPDPCTLVSQADVDAIFGVEMEQGESRETSGSGGTASGRSCNWGGLSTLSATIFVSTNYLVPLDVCEWCEPVAGYGDEAWGGITDLGSGGGQLMIVAGDLGVQVDAFGPEVTLDQLGTLADGLLAGLP